MGQVATFVFILSSLVSSVAFSQLFQKTWMNVPRETRRCDEVARRFGENLNRLTSVEIYWAGAERQNPTTCDVKISYLSEVELGFVSSVDPLAIFSCGAYRSEQECSLNLEHERQVQQAATGLTNWLSYCYKQSGSFSQRPFVAVVESIGKSPLQLIMADGIVDGLPIDGWPRALEEMASTAQIQKWQVATITQESYLTKYDHKLKIRLYNPERLWLTQLNVAPTLARATCDAQIGSVRSFLAQSKTPPLGVFCSDEFTRAIKLMIISLQNPAIPEGIGLIDDPKVYLTLAECMEKIAPTADFYHNSLHKKVLGGYCHEGTAGHTIAIFEDTGKGL